MRKPPIALYTFAPVIFAFVGIAITSEGLTFNVTYDSTTLGAPAGFFTAFQAAIDFFQANYSDPITINLQVGWGKINGQNLNPGTNYSTTITPPAKGNLFFRLKR
ncbi:MAG TPA: hypothetical protein VL361_20015 [Candidatus Limnocylindrales bacterium]|nr:hypothetical protein [Candidatus Limnocylindrales bacterium]